MTTDRSHLNVFRIDSIKLSILTVVNLLLLGWLTFSSLLTVVNLMLCFRVGDIKSATVSSQLTKMKTAKMKKMQEVNLLFLPFSFDTLPDSNNLRKFPREKTTFSFQHG